LSGASIMLHQNRCGAIPLTTVATFTPSVLSSMKWSVDTAPSPVDPCQNLPRPLSIALSVHPAPTPQSSHLSWNKLPSCQSLVTATNATNRLCCSQETCRRRIQNQILNTAK